MQISVNKKDNTIEFVPETDIDSFHLGRVFGQKSNSTTIVPPNKIKKVAVKVFDIWTELLSGHLK